MAEIEQGTYFTAETGRCVWRDVFTPEEAHLDSLSLTELEISNTVSPEILYKDRETLLFNLKDPVKVFVDGTPRELSPLDVLYVPLDASFRVAHRGEGTGKLYIYRARAEKKHPVYHARWAECSTTEKRIRRLKRKKVYLMFDVSEEADSFMAGYTFYDSYTRAWPPHNHTDQEEVYSFIRGRGAMSVYADDENQTFIREVEEGSHITIPLLNYHPVFSHQEPLAFIWCIAGKRYWVGDKNKDFMDGTAKTITT
ncbi:MAG: 5-deoxy-glucuronate isomerase [Spirochaetales bacterium]|nr:5-deoxy-glucuronate isomerase [Spirochaetales bacterium]